MLAGVTGVRCMSEGIFLSYCDKDDDEAPCVEGGAGGGMERSTGDGVSSAASVLSLLARVVDLIMGVELVDLDVLDPFF